MQAVGSLASQRYPELCCRGTFRYLPVCQHSLTHAGPNKMTAAGGQLPQGAGVNQNPFASSNQASASNTPADAAASAAPSEAASGDGGPGVKLSPVGTCILFLFVCAVCNSTDLPRCCAVPSHGSNCNKFNDGVCEMPFIAPTGL